MTSTVEFDVQITSTPLPFLIAPHISLPSSSLHPSMSTFSLTLQPIPSKRPSLIFLREACHNNCCSGGCPIRCDM